MSNYLFSFEKLEVWQLARSLAMDIYKHTSEFPSEEKYSLVSQIRRAALSVGANIAEGATRSSAKDQAHFTTLAFSSLMELFNHLVIASDLKYLSEDILNDYRSRIQLLSVKLSNLKATQLNRLEKVKQS